MIPVENLLYKLDMKLNKVVALEHQLIPLENKILALNEAQLKLVKVKLDTNNTLGLGLDSFKKRYQDVENLVEPASGHPLTLVESDPRINRWSAPLEELDPEYMFYLDAYMLANKGECLNRIIYINKDLVKHADIFELLLNPSYKPSFEYEETFCTISSSRIEVYTDGTFTPTTIYVSYIRYPQEIDFVGYVKLDGTNSITSNCELAAYLEDELVAFAIEELAMDTENVPAVQFTQQRIRTSE